MAYITIEQIGGACPFQAEGKILDCPFYLRARHGEYTLDVVEPGQEAVMPDNPIIHLEGDDESMGYMKTSTGLQLIGEAFDAMWDKWDWRTKTRKEDAK